MSTGLSVSKYVLMWEPSLSQCQITDTLGKEKLFYESFYIYINTLNPLFEVCLHLCMNIWALIIGCELRQLP